MNAETSSATAPPRFIIGIDLGTTNCAVAFIDTSAGRKLSDFPVEQFTAAGTKERRDTLPSFLFAPPGEPDLVAGAYARDHGALTAGRLISSAKSWLCHAGVNRKAAILPWHADNDVKPVSPVDAQAHILRHLREAWDAAHPAHPLARQEVYITVPASFDEIARELTVEAARQAGIPALVLLEEPQAAFYAWLSHHEQNWKDIVAPDDHVLICDVGGGTTDFTLIHARPDREGLVAFHRIAVGDHLILGGDNLDLALARHLEPRLAGGGKLDPRSWTTLVRLCRYYKESLLGENAPEAVSVVLPGAGSGLLSGRREAMLTRDEATALLLDGFMPLVDFDATPLRRASGFQEFGLPFAPDPAITKYLADFLRAHLPKRADGSITPPAATLLNGGLFESAHMRQRFADVIDRWFVPSRAVTLDHRRLDLAVARGAAYFGLARRGEGVQVISHLARSYYMGLATADGSPRALCLAPAGLAPGQPIRIDQHPLQVLLKTPVAFPMFVSSVRTHDAVGDVLTVDEESFKAMPPVQTVLTAGKSATQTHVEVHLGIALTELGTLDLQILEAKGSRAWKLSFDLRAATRTDASFHDGSAERSGIMESAAIDAAAELVRKALAMPARELGHFPLVRDLEQALGLPRADWPASVLRNIWNVLREKTDARRISAMHEQRWLNLTGFCLRPGMGFALDDWRVAETWKIYHAGLIHTSSDPARAEWWILWRRIAAGLTAGQQTTLAQPLIAALKALAGGKGRARLPDGRELKADDHETVEILRLLGALERLPRASREALGAWLLARIAKKGSEVDHGAAIWALGRLGARVPLHGAINDALPCDIASQWIREIIALPNPTREAAFTVVTLARATGDRYRDLDDPTRAAAAAWLRAQDVPAHWISLVEHGGELEGEEATHALGDSLPHGLMMLPS